MSHIAVRIDKKFRLQIAPIGGKAIEAQLSRLGAQLLGQALLEYAHVRTKSVDRGPVTILAAEAVADVQPSRRNPL